MRRLVSVLIHVILIVLFAAAAARAQATGALTGQLTDASGSALPGVTVEVVSEATTQMRSVMTGDDGFYTLPLVTPGRYTITATLSGFKTARREGVVVSVNDNKIARTRDLDKLAQAGGRVWRVTIMRGGQQMSVVLSG